VRDEHKNRVLRGIFGNEGRGGGVTGRRRQSSASYFVMLTCAGGLTKICVVIVCPSS
jgi:hypothetical protein